MRFSRSGSDFSFERVNLYCFEFLFTCGNFFDRSSLCFDIYSKFFYGFLQRHRVSLFYKERRVDCDKLIGKVG